MFRRAASPAKTASEMMDQKMYLVLAQYREGSDYEDQIGHRYHYPRKYFNQLTPDVEFIYFEPKRAGKGEYFGYGQIGKVSSDPDRFRATGRMERRFSRRIFQEIATGRLYHVDEGHPGHSAHLEVFSATLEHLGAADINTGLLDATERVEGRRLRM